MKADYTSETSASETLCVLETIALRCSVLGGNLSRTLYNLVQTKNYLTLLDFEFPYATLREEDVRDIIYARQIQALYQKAKFLPLGVDLEAAALTKFKESEEMCRSTNAKVRTWVEGDLAPIEGFTPEIATIVNMAGTIVAEVLGAVPSIQDLKLEFGPGANTNVKGAEACPRAKLSAPLQCSHELSPWVGCLLEEMPSWTSIHATAESDDSYVVPVTCSPGKLMFVPKNAKSLRSIVVEPLLNSVLQKGLGSYMKERLKRAGLDLTDQTLNQRLAEQGSVRDDVATIDLSMASDTISREVVKLLLPDGWFGALDIARSGSVVFSRGSTEQVLRFEKFSSMGNGYTFELESLIFWALTRATVRFTGLCNPRAEHLLVNVFGDDIICPRAACATLQEVLRALGFKVNEAKSYLEGPFRESCGADYFYGYNVRPFYVKDRISHRSLFSMHNFFMRNGERELASLVESLCHPEVLLYGPDNHGDGHLIGTYRVFRGREVERRGWDGAYFYTYLSKNRRVSAPMLGDLAIPTYSVYIRSGEESATDPFVVRGTRGYEKRRIYTLNRGIFR